MPTYVYKFIDTDDTIEVQQSFSDATLTEYTHPETGATMPVKKVFLPVGVTFKGDGFYKTDSRSATKKSGSAGDAPASDSSKPDSSKSDSSKSDSSKSDSSKSDSSKSDSSKSDSSRSDRKSDSSKSTTSSSGD